VQHGISPTFSYPCSPNGNDCTDIYAVSIPGVTPSAVITWFQAQQACGNAGKRLLRNGEWQQAAAGTPDLGTDNGTSDCNVASVITAVPTGSRSGCVSRWGVFDMVGNVDEWVEDWLQDNRDVDGGSTSTPTYGNDGIFGIDEAPSDTDRFPTALLRGGSFFGGDFAGVFALAAGIAPSNVITTPPFVGFRCGR
jgi:formylglycine-generating enzyme required for sulfatase activity